MRWMLTGCLLCGLVLPLGGAATEPSPSPGSDTERDARAPSPQLDAWQAESRRQQIAYARRLAAASGTRGLLQALMLDLPQGPDDDATQQRRQQYEQALAAQPILDAEHAWHAYGRCRRGGECSDEGVLAALRATDPDNVWTWLTMADAAQRRGDAAAVLDALQRAAAADINLGLERVSRLVLEAFDALPVPPMSDAIAVELGYPLLQRQGPLLADDRRMVFAMAGWTAYALPHFHSLSRHCRGGAAQARGTPHHAACLRLTTRLAREDSTLVGASLGHRLAAELEGDTPTGKALRASLRQLRWQQSQRVAASEATQDQPGEAARYVRDVLTLGERTALQAQLRRLGRAVEAPPDWQPPEQPARSQVRGGQEPPS